MSVILLLKNGDLIPKRLKECVTETIKGYIEFMIKHDLPTHHYNDFVINTRVDLKKLGNTKFEAIINPQLDYIVEEV